jgi:hypothetical protein
MSDESGKPLFDSYEAAGVVVPGASLLLGLWWLFPTSVHGLDWKDVSIGGLGIFAVAAFCVGHVLQAPANVAMDIIWSARGRPTERMRKQGGGLADAQVALIPGKVAELLHLSSVPDDDRQWHAVVSQLAAVIANAGRAARLDKFNGNFGLFRGLTGSLSVLTVVGLTQHQWWFSVTVALTALATAFRMQRFSRYYARELWVQTLSLPQSDTGTD